MEGVERMQDQAEVGAERDYYSAFDTAVCRICGRSMLAHASGLCRTHRGVLEEERARAREIVEDTATLKKAERRRSYRRRAAATPPSPSAASAIPHQGTVKPGESVTPADAA